MKVIKVAIFRIRKTNFKSFFLVKDSHDVASNQERFFEWVNPGLFLFIFDLYSLKFQ